MNLALLLEMAVDASGDRALVGSADTGLSAREVQRLALGGASLLRARDSRALVYLGENSVAFPVALFAAAHAGVPLVPLNYRLGEEQLRAQLAQHPGALIIGDRGMTPSEWLAAASVADPASTPDDDVPAVLMYTSGTTAAPKAVVLRHDNLVSYVVETVEFASAGPDEAALVSVPPYHIAAVANVLTNLYAGRRLVVLGRFDPVEWLDTVRREGITQALVVPTMLARLVECRADTDIPTLRSLAYGGASMPARVIERALELWPQVGFVNAYGLTETSSTVAALGPADHRAALSSSDPAVRARLGSSGLPLPGVALEVRDERGEVLPAGARGRIWVKGAQVSGEYLGSGSALDVAGFFDTRDDGYLDAAGYLFVAGRSDDTVIRGGENIAPAEVERVLLEHPAIADAVVVGRPDVEWGQRLEAVVVARGILDPAEVRDYVRGRLRSSKTPDVVHVWAELPYGETGKLSRRAIVAALEAAE